MKLNKNPWVCDFCNKYKGKAGNIDHSMCSKKLQEQRINTKKQKKIFKSNYLYTEKKINDFLKVLGE